MVNLSSCAVAQLPLILCMISRNSDFGIGGNVNFFFYRSEFNTHEHKIHHSDSEPENHPLTICIQIKFIYGTVFEIWSNLWRKVALRENPEKQAKNRNFLISTSRYQKYSKLTVSYMFLWMTNAMMQLVKIPKIQSGRQLWLKKSVSVFGKRQEYQIKKFNSHNYTLILQCPSDSKFSRLSYEHGCSHELWCRECASWHWNKYVLIYLELYFIHISKDILLLQAQNAIKQCKWHFSRKP